jgi:bacterioferritin (cytochrome b1)
MRFHIPKQQKPTRERFDIRLEHSLLQKLDRYCQYMESDRDYVISTVLQVVFKKDKGFAEWLESQDHAGAGNESVDRSARRTAM